MRREECDDGFDLVRRSRRAAEKALGSRIIGEPDRRGTRKCDAKRCNRQSAPVGPVRPCQEPLLGRTAAAQGAPGPADDAGVAPGLARQYRTGARLRSRDGAGSDRLRQRGADEPAAVATRTERSHLPLAGRRSLKPGFLLLRRTGARRPALLRASLARGVSAGLRSPSCGAEADAVSGAPRPRGKYLLSSLRTQGPITTGVCGYAELQLNLTNKICGYGSRVRGDDDRAWQQLSYCCSTFANR